MNVSMVGLDLAKNVFQAHGADSSGGVAFRKRVFGERRHDASGWQGVPWPGTNGPFRNHPTTEKGHDLPRRPTIVNPTTIEDQEAYRQETQLEVSAGRSC